MDSLDIFATALSLRLPEHLGDSAFVILPGLQEYRLTGAPWRVCADFRLWVTGTAGDPKYEEADIRRLTGVDAVRGVDLKFQGYAGNTIDQMKWVVTQILDEKGLTNIYICTAGYHVPRAILTFVKQWIICGDQRVIEIGAVPTIDRSSREGFSAGKYCKSGSVKEELARIEKYQAAGDIATPDEFMRFINSLNHEPSRDH